MGRTATSYQNGGSESSGSVAYLAAFAMTKKHLYNTSFGKVRWFVDRFGAGELFLKPARTILAPLIIPFIKKRSFYFQGNELPLFYHDYNMTWASERCLEV